MWICIRFWVVRKQKIEKIVDQGEKIESQVTQRMNTLEKMLTEVIKNQQNSQKQAVQNRDNAVEEGKGNEEPIPVIESKP